MTAAIDNASATARVAQNPVSNRGWPSMLGTAAADPQFPPSAQ